ncbi:hypothetical protein [Burkholderia anthina]|uniref:hypothetical protein n=1 Tax=Burkholderia anthina TaxID=179879 RepID=UPI00158E208C|nr:hypothetical protein [Burkholderia anthina]
MFATDQQTAVSALPTPSAAGTPGYFTGGNPATGQSATIVDADWLNMIQGELLSIVSAAGITPSKSTYNQVLQAIRALRGQAQVLADAGAANAYVAANPVPMTALPTATGMTQTIRIANKNTGPSTYAPDGLSAAPIYGMGGFVLQGGELVANGVATLMSFVDPLLNSGSLCWVLINCVGGAQQVSQATGSNQTIQLSQLLAQTNGSAGGAIYGGAVSAGWTQSKVLNFTTPSNGFVLAMQSVNVSGSLPASIENTISIAPSSTASNFDHTPLPMTDIAIQKLNFNTEVTVTGSVTADNVSGSWGSISVQLWYVFIPSN